MAAQLCHVHLLLTAHNTSHAFATQLAEHRREYKATHPSQENWTDFGHKLSQFVPSPVAHPAQAFKRSSLNLARPSTSHSPSPNAGKSAEEAEENAAAVDEGDRRRAAALSRMLNVGGGSFSEAEDEEMRRANKAAAQSHDVERYKAARKKLKAAVLEYYRGLEILKNYKILNRTGFAKILKKFEKATEVACGDAYYSAKVAPSILVSSESVEKLLKGTEEIFAAYFEHGNRKRALERLRINSSNGAGENGSTHHLSVARAGFYLGISLCATVGGLIEAMHADTQVAIPLWPSLLRVYGAELIPTLFCLLFGLNLAIWHRARINTVFIFEWDVRHALDYHQFFELPAFFLLLLSIAFWVSFLNPFPNAIAPTTWPLVSVRCSPQMQEVCSNTDGPFPSRAGLACRRRHRHPRSLADQSIPKQAMASRQSWPCLPRRTLDWRRVPRLLCE